MPTVNLNKEVFEELVGKKLPLEELKDRVSMLGTDLEKIEDNNIEVEVFPNRPDMLSEQGFARAFSAFIGHKTGFRKYEVKKSGEKVMVDSSVTMRPYTACAIIKNIKFDDERIREIMQIQEKLARTHGRNRRKSAYGLYPADKINFPIKYVAKDPKEVMFRPLGIDKEIKASEVEELHPKGIEYKWVAEGWEKYPFFIDGKDKVMCMLPYTNSHDTGKVDENTTEVFIECSGTDLENVNVALNIFVTMLSDMGGEIYSLDIVYPDKTITTPNLEPKKVDADINYINKRLGLELKEEELKVLLEKMNFGYEKGKILVPAYRADIMHQVDFVEEIAISYGYENFKEEIPRVSTIAQESQIENFKRKIAYIIIGLGQIELNTYNLTKKEEQTKMMRRELELIEVENPVNQDYNVMRSWLSPQLLDVLSNNRHYKYPQKIFDMGTIFKHNRDMETKVEENESLAIMTAHEKADFTEIKQILDSVSLALGLSFELEDLEMKSYIEGRSAKIFADNEEIGHLGEVHPEVLSNFDLQVPCAGLEINLTKLYKVFRSKI